MTQNQWICFESIQEEFKLVKLSQANKLTFIGAREVCRAEGNGSDLAKIESREVFDIVEELRKGSTVNTQDDFWIGISLCYCCLIDIVLF